MVDNGMIYFARSGENLENKLYLLPQMANRHGFICGATGTGKTVTLKVLAESFSQMGVPVFLSDVKGDIAGMISLAKIVRTCRSGSNGLDCLTRISVISPSHRCSLISMVKREYRSARRFLRWDRS